MRFRGFAAALVPLLLSLAPAFAVGPLEVQECQQTGDAKLTIAGCSQIVNDKTIDMHDRAVAALNLGIGFYAKNDLDDAIKAWIDAVTFEPSYVHAYNDLAQAYFTQNDLAKSISTFDQAIKYDPKHALSYKGRGIMVSPLSMKR